MKSEEGYIDVPGGKVWYRAVGDNADATPLLCLHGGPGFTHYYLEALEALADRRRVIFYDQLGCGRSDRPGDVTLWNVDRFVAELAQVRSALDLDRLHLFGSSWGGMLAMEYVLRHKPKLESLILCSSPASIPRWIEGCNELLAELPEQTQETIRDHEDRGLTECPEYTAAVLEFYKRHLCRLEQWPEGVERSFRDAGYQVYGYMNGPSEFTVVGTLKDWSVIDRLHDIEVPTLITSGEHDEARPDHMREIHERIAGSQLEILPGCSHLAFAEDPEAYFAIANAWFDRVEATPA